MKKFCLLFGLFCFEIALHAQNLQQQARIREIRELSKKNLDIINLSRSDSVHMDNHLHLEMNRMYCGSGMQKKTIDAYVSDCSVEKKDGVGYWRPFFIRIKYNFSALDYVHEYLMDSNTGHPIFLYSKCPDEKQFKEARLYFNTDGAFCYGTISYTNTKSRQSIKVLNSNDFELRKELDNFMSTRNFVVETMNKTF